MAVGMESHRQIYVLNLVKMIELVGWHNWVR